MGLDKFRGVDRALDVVWRRVDPYNYQAAYRRCGMVPQEDIVRSALACDIGTQQGIRQFTQNVCNYDSRSTAAMASQLSDQYLRRYGTAATAAVVQEIQSSIYTCYGTAREKGVFDAINAKQVLPCPIIEDNNFYSVPGGVIDGMEWYIGGRVDARLEDRSAIVEIKNRVYRLFRRVRPHDMIQIQAYAQLLHTPKAYLVECYHHYNDQLELGVMGVTRDDDMWQSFVLPRLASFVRTLMNILRDEGEQDAFLVSTDKATHVMQRIEEQLTGPWRLPVSSPVE